MATKQWTTKAWDELVAKYPKLDEKPEGVAFCAFAIDQGVESLPDIRELAKGMGIKLKFSGASVGSAKVAMGRKKAAKRGKGTAKAKPAGGTGKRRGRPPKAKAAVGAGEMKTVIAGLLEGLANEIEDARAQFDEGRSRLEKAKGTFARLKPVFEEYHGARAKKLGEMLAGI
ncbi:MAG: hypothetical protein R3F30_06770 [Planctomycetota bacterium]